MNVINAVFRGWGLALTHPSYILIRWLANLVFAILIVYPLALLLSADLDHSVFSLELLKQMDQLYPWEMAQRFGAELAGLGKTRLSFFLLFAVLGIYLSGGILSGLQRDIKLTWPEFFQACSTRFRALFFTALLCIIPLAVAIALPLLLARFIDSWHLGEVWHLRSWVAVAVLALLCVSFVSRFYDNTRLLLCRPNEPGSVLTNLGRSFSFTARFHFQTFAIWIIFTALHIGAFLLYSELAPRLGFAGRFGLLIELGALQILILLRITAELARLGAELDYLKVAMGSQKQPDAAPPPAETITTVRKEETTNSEPVDEQKEPSVFSNQG